MHRPWAVLRHQELQPLCISKTQCVGEKYQQSDVINNSNHSLLVFPCLIKGIEGVIQEPEEQLTNYPGKTQTTEALGSMRAHGAGCCRRPVLVNTTKPRISLWWSSGTLVIGKVSKECHWVQYKLASCWEEDGASPWRAPGDAAFGKGISSQPWKSS